MKVVPLTKINEIPTDQPIFIYGCGRGGRLVGRAVRILGRGTLAGFVDSEKSGVVAGERVWSVAEFRELARPETALIIASSHFDGIFAHVREIPIARGCFDARPLFALFYGFDERLDDAFLAELIDPAHSPRQHFGRGAIFVSAGLRRSGSTWLYNAMRLVLSEKYPGLYARWIEEASAEEAAEAEAVLIKTHDPTPFWAAKATSCFTCHRDLRDVVVSSRDMGWAGNTAQMIQAADKARADHDFWAPICRRDYAYDAILRRPAALIAEIAQLCGVALADDRIAAMCAKLSGLDGDRRSDEVHDATTLMHAQHRFDGRPNRFVDSLPRDAAVEIVRRHGDWLGRMGYDTTLTPSNESA